MGPLCSPTSVCVCVMCGSRQPCTVFGIAPSLILASFLCAKSRAARAPVGRPAPARPSGGPVASQPPSTQPTACVAWNITQYQLAAQTAIKRLSKFNRCHPSHIREDTGQPSVPVQEFNPIACSPSLPGPGIEPTAWPVCTIPWLVV